MKSKKVFILIDTELSILDAVVGVYDNEKDAIDSMNVLSPTSGYEQTFIITQFHMTVSPTIEFLNTLCIGRVVEILGYTNEDVIVKSVVNSVTVTLKLTFDGDDLIVLHSEDLIHVGDNFLDNNDTLLSLDLPNCKSFGKCCLYDNTTLTSLNIPNVEHTGDCFLDSNEVLSKLNMTNIKNI